MANSPFSVKDWGGKRLNDDIRLKFGILPEGNANYAWLQHFYHHLSVKGMRGVVPSFDSKIT